MDLNSRVFSDSSGIEILITNIIFNSHYLTSSSGTSLVENHMATYVVNTFSWGDGTQAGQDTEVENLN